MFSKASFIIFALLLGGAAYVRLAPSAPDKWHLDPNASEFELPKGAAAFCPGPNSRYSGASNEGLERLMAVAEAWPRTTRLAGSAEEGRITYVTRSRVFGFPDYTTIALRDVGDTSDLCLIAQQRFGLDDFGVNAGRITSWVAEAYGLEERPPMIWVP